MRLLSAGESGLAATMFTDVVDSTSRGQADEDLELHLLEDSYRSHYRILLNRGTDFEFDGAS